MLLPLEMPLQVAFSYRSPVSLVVIVGQSRQLALQEAQQGQQYLDLELHSLHTE
jgi:hypothetical protein